MDEWAAHMSHWIIRFAAICADRVFDALITEVPILPASLRTFNGLLQEHLFYFEPSDVVAPHEAIVEAAKTFPPHAGRGR